MADTPDHLTINEARKAAGLDAYVQDGSRRSRTELVRVGHVRRLQNQHEKTVQMMSDPGALQDIIDNWDARVHWLDWETCGNDGEPTIAHCGAVVHNGKHWYSVAADEMKLDTVSCPACSSLPEYNLKLLAQTDLGDDSSKGKIQFPPLRRVVQQPMTIPQGLTDYVNHAYGTAEGE